MSLTAYEEVDFDPSYMLVVVTLEAVTDGVIAWASTGEVPGSCLLALIPVLMPHSDAVSALGVAPDSLISVVEMVSHASLGDTVADGAVPLLVASCASLDG